MRANKHENWRDWGLATIIIASILALYLLVHYIQEATDEDWDCATVVVEVSALEAEGFLFLVPGKPTYFLNDDTWQSLPAGKKKAIASFLLDHHFCKYGDLAERQIDIYGMHTRVRLGSYHLNYGFKLHRPDRGTAK